MGEMTSGATDKAPKKSWFKGFKSEWKKIVWPDKESLVKQLIVVICVTVALGIVIYVLDWLIKLGMDVVIG